MGFLLFVFPLVGLGIPLDSVTLKAIHINGIHWYATVEKLISQKGHPSRKESMEVEMESGALYKYHYDKDIYFVNGKQQVIGFFLSNPESFIAIGKNVIKLHRSDATLKKHYPKEYQTFLRDKVFRLRVDNSDTYIVFNLRRGMVESIESWIDN